MLNLPTLAVSDSRRVEPNRIENVQIPDGWWMATFSTPDTPEELFPLTNVEKLPDDSAIFSVSIHGVRPYEAQWYVTDREPSTGLAPSFSYAIIAPQPFLLMFRDWDWDWDCDVDSYMIAREIKHGSHSRRLPEPVKLRYQRGAKNWGWVNLKQLHTALGATLFPWEHFIKSVRVGGTKSSLSADIDQVYFGVDITIDDPASEIVTAEIPSSESVVQLVYDGYDELVSAPAGTPRLFDLPPERVWIPGQTAKEIACLVQFMLRR